MTYKRADGQLEQGMAARGNAYIRSDEYEGWGEVITYEGQKVTLYAEDPERPGGRGSVAKIVSRFQGTSQDGRKIVYDRLTNRYETIGSTGGTIQTPPPQPKPPPQLPPGAVPMRPMR